MSNSRISQSSALPVVASVFATIFVGFGVNAIIQPDNALTFFEFKPPALPADKQVVDYLLAVYGVRDIFMGLAIYASAFFGSRKTLGWILIAASGVAFADGAVCYVAGGGQWSHWGYAPVITIVGSLLLGLLG